MTLDFKNPLVYWSSIVILILVLIFVYYYGFAKKSLKKLLFFFSPSCGHCKNFMPEFEKFERIADADLEIQKLEVSENAELAKRYNVEGVPFVILLVGDKKIKYDGTREAKDLLKFTQSY